MKTGWEEMPSGENFRKTGEAKTGEAMSEEVRRKETGTGRRPAHPETVLVTGATGFLGEYLIRRLAGKYRVLALGRNREKGRRLEVYGAMFCQGDFTRRDSCACYFKEADYVIHAGALSSVWGRWEDFYRTNVAGTELVAQLCREYGVRRLVYVSSPSIYTGKTDRYDIREEEAPEKNELNYYIRSKLMAEGLIRKWNRKGLETVILRPRGLIGPGDTSLVPRLLRANAGVGIPLFNGGRNLVDLTSVENAALACELALTARGASGGVFNITNGEPTEFRVLLESFLKAIGERPHYRNLPFGLVYGAAGVLEKVYGVLRLPGEPPLTRYTVCTLGHAQTMDIRRAEKILGYRPEKTLEEAIREYGDWWRAARPESRGRDEKRENAARQAGQAAYTLPGKVEEVKLYRCGSCVNDLSIVFRGLPREKREFPARAALIRHRELGNILYDTGYSEEILRGGLFLRLYRLLNPVRLGREETLAARLKEDGISPESVRRVILSHAHPDHVGGLSQLSGVELVATGEVLEVLHRHRIRDLMPRNLVPPKGCIRAERQPENALEDHFLCRYFERVYDLFGDGSLIGVVLDGHCRGQLGLWIPDVSLFLAADACWGGDLAGAVPRMRLLPRLLQKDFDAYRDSLGRICRMKREHPEIRVVFTHQKERRKNRG